MPLSDVVWGDLYMSWFECAPLVTLAEFMRDQKWVDMRVEERTMRRVRIERITVRLDGEDVIVRQEWLDGGEDTPTFRHCEHTLDADAIWRVLPTNYHIEQVVPATAEALADGVVIAAIVSAVSFVTNVPINELSDPQYKGNMEPAPRTDARHQCLILAYEMTNLSGEQVCKRHFGYKSQTPIISARYKLTHSDDQKDSEGRPLRATPQRANAWCKRLRKVSSLVEDRLGYAPRRTKWYRDEPMWLDGMIATGLES